MKNQIQQYITYAVNNLELNARDEQYKANRLLEIMQSDLSEAELDDAIYGELSLLPSQVDKRFSEILNSQGSKAATDWLYNYCVKNMYVKKAALDKNPRFENNGLVITINKAKPEFRDPKKAKEGNSVDGGFASCVICRENEGFGARNKRNLRTVSLTLGGQQWFWQYSPYGYFNEHGIAVNTKHTPMYIDKGTFYRLMDFIDIFPQYFIGCNAPLPRIGGSVLAHDHYQGGGEILPLQKTKATEVIKIGNAEVELLDWYGTAVRVVSKARDEIAEVGERIRTAWVNYDNKELGIVHEDNDGIHNSISPTVIKTDRGYEMTVILRSNITSDEYPDGVFHAHPEFHVIKKESIGLIEAQGLFILPGRLEQELNEIESIIEQNKSLPKKYDQFKLVYDETKKLYNSGKYKSVHSAMQDELGSICKRILQNTAVFKDNTQLKQFITGAIK